MIKTRSRTRNLSQTSKKKMDQEGDQELMEVDNNKRPLESDNETVQAVYTERDKRKKRKEVFGEVFEFGTTENKEKFATCKLCKVQNIERTIKMKDANTSGIARHFKNFHEAEYNKAFVGLTAECHSSNKFDQDIFNRMTVEWIAKKYLPINFFDDEMSQEYFGYLNKDAKVPQRNSLHSIIGKTFTEMQKNVIEKLRKNPSKISFAFDGWTSISATCFYGITGHYVDEDWNLKALTLEFAPANGGHAGVDMAKLFLDFLKKFDLQKKIGGITLDNTACNTTFIKELGLLLQQSGIYFDTDDQHFRCMAHIENLGAQSFLLELKLQTHEEQEIENKMLDNVDEQEQESLLETSKKAENLSPVGKIKKLFIKIKYSEQLRNKLECCCVSTDTSYVAPGIDSKTRWYSTFEMIEKGKKLRKALELLCLSNKELADYYLLEEEWELLEAAHKHLKLFKSFSKALSGEKYVSLPLVVIGLNLLLDQILKAAEDLDKKAKVTPIDLKIRDALEAAHEKILKHYRKCNWIYCAVLILDPRHRLAVFDKTEWGKAMKSFSLKKFEEIYKTEYYVEKHDNSSNDSEAEKAGDQASVDSSDDEIDFLSLYRQNVVNQKKSKKNYLNTHNKEEKWRSELNSYLKSDLSPATTDILKWWKEHQSVYPTLAKMARDLYGIQATSVSVERLFSRSSLTVRKHRNRLGKEVTRELLCINDWTKNQNYSIFKCMQ